MVTIFKQHVLNIVRSIPRDTVMTYREVAKKAGSPRAYRAVGTIMKQNHDPEIPCHRVIRSDGTVGGYNNGGPSRKAALLSKENNGFT